MKTLEQNYHSKQSGINSSGSRIIGYDFARALAILGMVIVNYKVVMEADKNGPEWFVWLIGLLEGRAAATFVILAGVGLSLLSQKARLADDVETLSLNRNTLLKRALFLFVVGLLYISIWPADILHFYGLYIAIGALLLKVSNRRLWFLAWVFMAIFVMLLLFFDYAAGWNWETLNYSGFWTIPGMIRHLFFNGFYPVFPWTAFLFIGMWLGRQNVSDPKLRKRILRYSITTVIAVEGVSWLLIQLFLKSANAADGETIQALFGIGPMPPMPFYVLSAGGVAFIVIIFSIMFTERFPASRWIQPFVATGQLALTLYVAHVVIGMGILEAIGLLEKQTLLFAVSSAIGFYASGVVFSVFWSKRFRRGPLEWMMRRLT